MTPRNLSRTAAVGLAALALSACTPADSPAPSGVPTLSVATGFYPLTFVAERIGGANVEVTTLTSPGAEPHDLELSPARVRTLRDTDIVLFLKGFQPAVEDAIASTGVRSFDAAHVIDLVPGHDHDDEGDEHDDEGDDHGDEGGADPHFWLDPSLLAEFSQALAEEFASIDPVNADTYRTNADALTEELDALDASFTTGLASCERDTILVSHEAFAYLTARYGLEQEGLSGINPDAEPSPARIREVREIAAALGATTVFVEALLDPSVVEAFADDAGLVVATLDPIESATGGDDYISIMTRNLAALRDGLGCD